MDTTILIVEDENAISEMLRFSLDSAGFSVVIADDDQAARRILADLRPDLIIMDWMLPGRSGIEIAKELKNSETFKDIPIIMLTARGEEDDKIRGLESGADDYVTKPFSPRELIARVKAVLRRTSPLSSDDVVEVNGLQLDSNAHRVTVSGKVVDLGPTEFKLLCYLMTHPERVYSRSQLLDRVWGNNVYVEERTVDVHIRRLRKALEDSGHAPLIQTVRGAGYRFSTQV